VVLIVEPLGNCSGIPLALGVLSLQGVWTPRKWPVHLGSTYAVVLDVRLTMVEGEEGYIVVYSSVTDNIKLITVETVTLPLSFFPAQVVVVGCCWYVVLVCYVSCKFRAHSGLNIKPTQNTK
jgi:hypothetical protein